MERALPPSSPSPGARSEPLDLSPVLLSGAGKNDKRIKAMRLLVTGRLRVFWVDLDAGIVAAECRGESGKVYRLAWDGKLWTCSCPARIDCSHLNALWAVVAI